MTVNERTRPQLSNTRHVRSPPLAQHNDVCCPLDGRRAIVNKFSGRIGSGGLGSRRFTLEGTGGDGSHKRFGLGCTATRNLTIERHTGNFDAFEMATYRRLEGYRGTRGLSSLTRFRQLAISVVVRLVFEVWTSSANLLTEPKEIPGRVSKCTISNAIWLIIRFLHHFRSRSLHLFEYGVTVVGRENDSCHQAPCCECLQNPSVFGGRIGIGSRCFENDLNIRV